MAAYVGMLNDLFPGIAGHLLTASIMSAPAAIVMSKLAMPEIDEPVTAKQVDIQKREENINLIDAAASGAKTGITLAINVGGMLLAFIALVNLGNAVIRSISNHFYFLIAEASAPIGALNGALLGAVVGVFIVGRAYWRGTNTKHWIGALLILSTGITIGYLSFSPSNTVDSVTFLGFIDSLMGFGISIGLLMVWRPDYFERWGRSHYSFC